MAPRLAKLLILSGLQCERGLWLESWPRNLLDVDAAQQRQFDIGNELESWSMCPTELAS